jgi:hypothetical protein
MFPYTGSAQHHKICFRQIRAVAAERLPYSALDAIARYRPACRLDRYRHPQSRLIACPLTSEYREKPVGGAHIAMKNPVKLCTLPETTLWLECLRAFLFIHRTGVVAEAIESTGLRR